MERGFPRLATAGTTRSGAGLSFRAAGTALGSWGSSASSDPLRATLALMAPGTALRDGLERILRGRTGALIVLGDDRTVESLCTGGVPLGIEFSATRLRGVWEMGGAGVPSSAGTPIVRGIGRAHV